MDYSILEKDINDFCEYLKKEERSKATIEKYTRDILQFYSFASGGRITKELVVSFKQYLISKQYAVRSINSMLVGVNAFLAYLGLHECKVKLLRLQRSAFCCEEKELSRSDYMRLLQAAQAKKQISMVMQTICATGIRVSELKSFTVEAVKRGTITVSCKNKLRTVLLPKKLRNNLLKYAAEQRIKLGCIFINKKGNPLNRSQIWAQMKKLCEKANVNPQKVFPHNLRKLFARAFYDIEKDIAKLADLLGHSSIDTTRIYIISSGTEHRKKIEQLKLVL